MDDGEEVGAREAAEDGGLIRCDGGGVRVVDEECVDRGAVCWVGAKCRAVRIGERLAEDRHINGACQAADGAGLGQVRALQGRAVPLKSAAGGKLESAAVMLPRAGERGQHGDGARGGSSVVAALHAVVDANDGRRGRGVIVGEALDIGDGNAGQGRNVVGWVVRDAFAELIEAAGPAGDVVLIVEAVADDDMHHAQRESRVGAGIDRNVPVRGAGGACGVGIDDDELCAVAAGFFDEGPEVDVIAVDIGGPGEDELRVREGFGVGAELAAVNGDEGLAAGFGANGAIELRGAETVEEAAIHGAVAELADGAGIGVGQD